MSDRAEPEQEPRGGHPEQQLKQLPVDGIVRDHKPIFSVTTVLWVVASFVVSSLLVSLGANALPMIGVSLANVDENVFGFILSAFIYVVFLAIVLGGPKLFKLWSGRISYPRLLGLTRLMQWRDIIFAVIGFVVYLAAAVGLVMVVTHLFSGFNADQSQDLPFSKSLAGSNAIFVFLALVVVAPVAEEIIFRGYLFGTLRRTLPLWAAAVVASIVFGAVHLQWNVGIDVFMMSLVSCYLRYKTGSLWASILLHMAKNGLAFYTLYIAGTIIR